MEFPSSINKNLMKISILGLVFCIFTFSYGHVIFYKFKSPLRPLTDWILLPHFRNTLGLSILIKCQNR